MKNDKEEKREKKNKSFLNNHSSGENKMFV